MHAFVISNVLIDAVYIIRKSLVANLAGFGLSKDNKKVQNTRVRA
tara:strand:+ start:7877 stop:8011 length:135 start_codon:yes stop_codon:yes gene_type:complete